MFKLAEETRRLLDLFRSAEYGDEFTYDEIARETGCDVRDRDRGRVYSVIRVLERDHRRTLLNVRGKGYKVAHPREHLEAMTIRQARAGKQVELARRTGAATAFELLNDRESEQLAAMQVHLSRVAQMVDNHERRLQRLERQVGVVDEPPIEGTAEEE